jgi:hypothetical protein
MDLIQAAWVIRDLGQSVSALHIEKDASIIAGGWDGALKKWDHEGAILWSTQCADRIESILVKNNLVIVTAGLQLTCICDGEILWSHALEGSANLLTFFNGQIIATSSVYDIEHGDFMESAIWKFSLEGELIHVDRMGEKPWFIHPGEELIVGLGRPKCGVLIGENYQDLATESPVTCGITGSMDIILGHADGTVSSIKGTQVSKEAASIESLLCTKDGYIAALETGDLVARTSNGEEIWSSNGQQITTQAFGFNEMRWCGRWQITSGSIEVRDSKGDLITSAPTSRAQVSNSTEQRIGFGFEDGQILVWEKELFERRSNETTITTDGRRSALAAKLRSLRE